MRKIIAAALLILIMVMPVAASAEDSVKDQITVNVPAGWEISYGERNEPLCSISKEGASISVRYIYVEDAMSESVDPKNEKEVTDAFYQDKEKLAEKFRFSWMNLEDTVKNDEGYIMAVGKTGANGYPIYFVPFGDGLWRATMVASNAVLENQAEKILLTYRDTEKLREDFRTKFEKKEKQKGLMMVLEIAGFALFLVMIGVVLTLVAKRTDRKRQEDMDLHPEKYRKKVSREKQEAVELTCRYCGQKFIVMVDEKDVEIVRKTKERCPKCQERDFDHMRDIAIRTYGA